MNLAIWDIESSSANTDFGSIIEIGGILVDENFKDSCCKSIKEIMEKAVTLDVPLVVDINHGNNWDEAH